MLFAPIITTGYNVATFQRRKDNAIKKFGTFPFFGSCFAGADGCLY